MNVSMKTAITLNNAMIGNFAWSEDSSCWVGEVSIPLEARLEVTHSFNNTKAELQTIGVDMIDMSITHHGALMLTAWDVPPSYQRKS